MCKFPFHLMLENIKINNRAFLNYNKTTEIKTKGTISSCLIEKNQLIGDRAINGQPSIYFNNDINCFKTGLFF